MTVTLADLYGSYADLDEDEALANNVSASDFDVPFTVKTLQPNSVKTLQPDLIQNFARFATKEQKQTVAHYKRQFQAQGAANEIIVLNRQIVLDGQHRAVAAWLAKVPISYIDISECSTPKRVVDNLLKS